MKTATIYIAEDGTKFLKEETCRKYEEAFNANPNPGIILLDNTGSIIPLSKFSSAIWINIIDPYITKLRLESIKVEEEFPFIANIPEEKGYYHIGLGDAEWDSDTKEIYDSCTGMDTYNDLTWYTCSQILISIHENYPEGYVKVTDVEGNVIYDRMPVLKAINLCIDDRDNKLRRMVWYKEIKDTTYVIIH